MITMFQGTKFVKIKSLFEIYFGLIPIPSSCSTYFPLCSELIQHTKKQVYTSTPGNFWCYFYRDDFFNRVCNFGIRKKRTMLHGLWNFIFHEVKRADKIGSNISKCGWTLRKTCNITCAFLISKKMKLVKLIHMDKVYTHWKRL